MRGHDVIPAVTVMRVEYRGLFGRVRYDWVLPPVPVSTPTRAQRRATDRLIKRDVKGRK